MSCLPYKGHVEIEREDDVHCGTFFNYFAAVLSQTVGTALSLCSFLMMVNNKTYENKTVGLTLASMITGVLCAMYMCFRITTLCFGVLLHRGSIMDPLLVSANVILGSLMADHVRKSGGIDGLILDKNSRLKGLSVVNRPGPELFMGAFVTHFITAALLASFCFFQHKGRFDFWIEKKQPRRARPSYETELRVQGGDVENQNTST